MQDTNMDNTVDIELDLAADRSLDLSSLLLDLFKGLNANPVEALTALITTAAVTSRGLGIPRDVIDDVLNTTFSDVYSIPLPPNVAAAIGEGGLN